MTAAVHNASGIDIAGDASALLGLLRFTSPSLPIGAYAYSRGLEYAVSCGAVHDEASAERWISGLVCHAATRLEAPVLLRQHAAFCAGDDQTVARWNELLLASRESRELRLEDTQLGAAFARLLANQGITQAVPYCKREDICYVTMFALATSVFHVPPTAALLGFLWTQAEGQVSAAVRLVPLGQTAGQNLLTRIGRLLPACLDTAQTLADDDIGAFTPGLALASALHETQYTRLFRS